MSTTITETITINNVFKDQFLSANLDEVEHLQNLSKKVNIFLVKNKLF